jgi:hypothetical protein
MASKSQSHLAGLFHLRIGLWVRSSRHQGDLNLRLGMLRMRISGVSATSLYFRYSRNPFRKVWIPPLKPRMEAIRNRPSSCAMVFCPRWLQYQHRPGKRSHGAFCRSASGVKETSGFHGELRPAPPTRGNRATGRNFGSDITGPRTVRGSKPLEPEGRNVPVEVLAIVGCYGPPPLLQFTPPNSDHPDPGVLSKSRASPTSTAMIASPARKPLPPRLAVRPLAKGLDPRDEGG